jgi:hypothetical protein
MTADLGWIRILSTILDLQVQKGTNSKCKSQPLQDIQFNNRLETTGSGFSLQMGGIANITDHSRMEVLLMGPLPGTTLKNLLVQEIVPRKQWELAVYLPISWTCTLHMLRTPGSVTGGIAYIILAPVDLLVLTTYSSRDYSQLNFLEWWSHFRSKQHSNFWSVQRANFE